ncbi:MAG: acyl-CoA dehydrogenase family protein [Steroidobacteraceae bacterium]
MWTYQPPLEEIAFVIDDWLQAPVDWSSTPNFADLDKQTAQQVLAEAGRFAGEVLLPINSPGDLEGCRYESGRVQTPAGYRRAYRSFVAAGWPSLACAAETGGQGLPQLLNAALYEMLTACCHAWSMYPGLAHGAYECLRVHGSESLKARFLPQLVSGEWLATMCLTEAHAGSDLGLLRTRAEPCNEGDAEPCYRITGNKIFISGGEHDLTDNIIHLVLARLPDAPVGTKGISLFLIPKLLPGETGLQPNGVRCAGIEKKMGIKGSATCSLSFDQAKGWLIGEPNRGLAAMFVMMNAARLHVALQGLAHAEIAHQNALSYARERLQMRATQRSNAAADPIILHPAVRRLLLEQRAVVQAQRMLGYWIAHLLDLSEHHPDSARRTQSAQLVSLLTPIAKATFTENGFALSSSALQIFGGHGYIHDNGIEQSVRDSRIAQIYEGTTEIQAIDLVTRKVMADGGAALGLLLDELRREVHACENSSTCVALGNILQDSVQLLEQATVLVTAAATDRERALRGAIDYLYLAGVVLNAYALIKAARIDSRRDVNTPRLETARFYCDFLLPAATHRHQLLKAACTGLPELQ